MGRDMNDNLKSAYPGAIEGWEGCYDKDCLPACDLRKNHCERLELFLELGRIIEEEAKWTP